MDATGLVRLLEDIEAGRVRVVARDTVEPSALCHELINANPYAFLDDAPLEERRTRAVSLPRAMREEIGGPRVCDEAAVALAEDEARPPIRDADELHDALLSAGLLADQALADRPELAAL